MLLKCALKMSATKHAVLKCALRNECYQTCGLTHVTKCGLKFEWSFSVLLNLSATKHVVLNLSALFCGLKFECSLFCGLKNVVLNLSATKDVVLKMRS